MSWWQSSATVERCTNLVTALGPLALREHGALPGGRPHVRLGSGSFPTAALFAKKGVIDLSRVRRYSQSREERETSWAFFHVPHASGLSGMAFVLCAGDLRRATRFENLTRRKLAAAWAWELRMIAPTGAQAGPDLHQLSP